MSGSQNFVDNLEYLHTVVSVALDYLAANREEFANNAHSPEKLKVEKMISSIRTLIDTLEKELHALDDGLSKTMESAG